MRGVEHVPHHLFAGSNNDFDRRACLSDAKVHDARASGKTHCQNAHDIGSSSFVTRVVAHAEQIDSLRDLFKRVNGESP